jgi:triacylglycerol lipase
MGARSCLFVLILAGCASHAPKATEQAGAFRSKYPIVLHHGFLAGSSMHWPGAKAALHEKGYLAYGTEVFAASSIEVRGRQLAKQIDEILKVSGAVKVNVIAHSMGGLDARFVVSTLKYGDRIASVTTLSTPHRGTPLADQMMKKSPAGLKLWGFLVDVAARLSNGASTFSKFEAMDAVKNLTEAYVEHEFNARNPDDPKVYYQSWAGQTTPKRYNLIKEILRDNYQTIYAVRGENDGVVPVSSGAWGVFRGTVAADHLSLAGYSFSEPHEPEFDHIKFLAGIAEELAAKGF